MFKRQLLALLLALSLLIPAALAEEAAPADPQAEIDALNARIAELEATVDDLEARLAEYEAPQGEYAPDSAVVTFDGGSVPLSAAQEKYRQRAAYYEAIDIDEADYADDLKQDVLQNLAEDAILAMKAQEMGVYDLTDADRAEAEADARETYEANVEYYLSYFYDESLSEEDIRRQTEEYLAGEGVSYEDILTDCLSSVWKQRLFDAVTQDVTVTEEDIRAMYDEGLSNAMETYLSDPEMFEYDYAYGDLIYYHPEGYRRIDFVQLSFTDDEATLASDLINEISVTDEDGRFALEAELDELYEALSARYADLISRAAAGEDLEALAQEFHLDECASLPVTENSTTLSEEFCAAAMALSAGQTSEPVRNDFGLWIMRYISDIPPGEVPYEEMHDLLSESALDAARRELYFNTVDQWIEDANIVIHPEML